MLLPTENAAGKPWVLNFKVFFYGFDRIVWRLHCSAKTKTRQIESKQESTKEMKNKIQLQNLCLGQIQTAVFFGTLM